MAELYRKVFENDNIKTAIIRILKQNSSKIAGPDGINSFSLKYINNQLLNEDKIIKEIKMRLRRCKKINSKIISEQNRTLSIINLYDRIAQQAVYQIIYPIIESKFSKHDYSFKQKQSIKIPVSKIVAGMANAKHVYTIELNFDKYFKNIPLTYAIGVIKKLGVSNSKLLKTIKYLMYYSQDYNGIGLSQDTILGSLLINCCLNQVDAWIENNIDTNHRLSKDVLGFKRNCDNFAQWLISKGRKCHGTYYRYIGSGIILCATRSEQLYIYEQLKNFLNEWIIVIDDIKLGYNCFNFLGFHIKKKRDESSKKWCINITPSDIAGLRKEIKSLMFRSGQECVNSLKKIVNIMNHYDICNNMAWVIKHINDRMYRHTLRHGSNIKCIWNKENKERRYTYIYQKRLYNISPWEIRRRTKQSCKDYLLNSTWLSLKEQINDVNIEWYRPYFLERTALWIKQQGKDYCTNQFMNPQNMHIHHLDGNNNNNKWKNLILVTPETHRMIHSNYITNNAKILKCRKVLKS